MPHLEKLGSHVMVINYKQACVSPEALTPPVLLSSPACTHTSAASLLHMFDSHNVGVMDACDINTCSEIHAKMYTMFTNFNWIYSTQFFIQNHIGEIN